MEFIETLWKWPNDALFAKKLCWESWKCIIVMFHLAHIFTHLASQWLFLGAAFLHSEPLHFSSKSVEFLHASLYHLSLKNKLTLDVSRYIWKRLLGDTLVVTFFLIVTFSIIVPEISKMCNLSWNSLKLCGNDQIMHCLWKNLVRSSWNAL